MGALRLQAPFNILFFFKVAGLGKANTLKGVINRDQKNELMSQLPVKRYPRGGRDCLHMGVNIPRGTSFPCSPSIYGRHFLIELAAALVNSVPGSLRGATARRSRPGAGGRWQRGAALGSPGPARPCPGTAPRLLPVPSGLPEPPRPLPAPTWLFLQRSAHMLVPSPPRMSTW